MRKLKAFWEKDGSALVIAFFLSCIPIGTHLSIMDSHNVGLCEKALSLAGASGNAYDVCTWSEIKTWGSSVYVVAAIWWFITWQVIRVFWRYDKTNRPTIESNDSESIPVSGVKTLPCSVCGTPVEIPARYARAKKTTCPKCQ